MDSRRSVRHRLVLGLDKLVPHVPVPHVLLNVRLGGSAGGVVPAHAAAPPLDFPDHVLQQRPLDSCHEKEKKR